MVHCSAGCGRTGSICVIDYVWGLLKTGKLSQDFSVFNLVQDMRRQRIAMVQTVDQVMIVMMIMMMIMMMIVMKL